jgi:putative tryptophan/tyrosine transport system substrate-binding protein
LGQGLRQPRCLLAHPARAQVRPVQCGGENAERGSHDEDDDRIRRHGWLPLRFGSHDACGACGGFDLNQISLTLPQPSAWRGTSPQASRAARVYSGPGGPAFPPIIAVNQNLSESGFVEGRNVAVEYRYAEAQFDRLPSLMSDLVRRQVAVIVATGSVQGALAAKAATTTIPIVFTTGGDPVKEGLVHSLNRPGGNLTGVTTSFGEAAPKRLGLLREIAPKAAVIGVLVNPNDPVTANAETNDMRAAARLVGQHIEILQAGTERDIDRAFANLIDLRFDALLVSPDPLFVTQANQLIALAARHAIPTLYWRREFAEAGGLMSYGSNLADALRVVGVYAGRILKGEKPGDLPVQQPTKFELVVNGKAAKAIGLTIPESFLARADEVIE